MRATKQHLAWGGQGLTRWFRDGAKPVRVRRGH
jgi:hypothetical protein